MTDYTKEREEALSKASPYVAGRHVPGHFSVVQRDTHHFDIISDRRPGYVEWYLKVENPTGMGWPLADNARERAFAIRGEPGNIIIRDERWDKEAPRPRPVLQFPSVESAMAWVFATLAIGDEKK